MVEIQHRYNKTEIGIIPSDWEVKEFGESVGVSVGVNVGVNVGENVGEN